MIVAIGKDHPIFRSAEYQSDIVPFNLMESLRQYMRFSSDGKNFVIGETVPPWPAWIWTVDCIDTLSLEELCAFWYEKNRGETQACFAAKPDIADFLAKPFFELKHATEKRIHMASYENRGVIPAKNNSVIPQRPTERDIPDIAECLVNYEYDCFGRSAGSDMLDEAANVIKNPLFFVVKSGSTVASMAQSARETSTHMTVNHVYTRPEYRCNGYAAALAAHISGLILEKGKTPALYTDLANPSSNKAYKNVGFTECGRVDEVRLKWN